MLLASERFHRNARWQMHPVRPGFADTLFQQGQGVIEMLVLSRKVGERIHVGDDVVLEIRRIAGNRVTLALDAPRHVRILRGELDTPAREFRSADMDSCSTMAMPSGTPILSQESTAVCREYAS